MPQSNSNSPAINRILSKIVLKENVTEKIAEWRKENKTVVFTNGCFDIIHRGHIDYLAKAADLGDKLIIGVNSDASVKRLGKSSSRPLQDELTRAMILAALEFVSIVVIFNDDTPLGFIKLIQPDMLVKGADYDAKETNKENKKYIVGSDSVIEKGGAVQTIDFLEGFSTTSIEEKIKNSL